MKIICATDFSDQARAAAEMAAGLASKTGGSVVLVHVIDPSPLLGVDLAGVTGTLEGVLRTSASAELTAEVQRLDRHGVSIETRVEVGQAVNRLREVAEKEEGGLIVLGSHGRRGAARFFVGSVAEEMARQAPCPVVVTRGLPYPDEGVVGRGRLHVAVVADGTPGAEAALAWVKELRSRVPCDVSFLQAYRRSDEEDRFGMAPAPGEPHEYQPRLRPLLERELRRWVGELPGTGRVELRLREVHRSADEELALEAELLQPDLVAVGVSQRRGSGGGAGFTPSSALRAFKLPVLCVPERLRAPADGRIPVIRTVLVGTDLTDFSNQVVPSAYTLISPGGGQVQICHVRETDVPMSGIPSSSPRPELDPGLRAEIEDRLARLVPPEAVARGITTRIVVAEADSVAEGLRHLAERADADVVVVASHGRGVVQRALMGSVATDLVTQTTRPVMVLHPRRR